MKPVKFHALIVLIACSILGGPKALAADTGLTSSREILHLLRQDTFLLTDCEKAFDAFWKVFRGEGEKGLLRDPSSPDGTAIFGYGNLDAAPMLPAALAACAEQTGRPGGAVVDALAERERRKLRRTAQHKASIKLLKGF